MHSEAIERFHQATAAHAAAEEAVNRTADRRARACADLHTDGWSFGRIATELGLSRSRVQQLVERGRGVEPEELEPAAATVGLEHLEHLEHLEPVQVEQVVATGPKLRRQTDPRSAATFYTWSHPAGVELVITRRRFPNGRQWWVVEHAPGSSLPPAAEWADPTGERSPKLADVRADLDRLAGALESELEFSD